MGRKQTVVLTTEEIIRRAVKRKVDLVLNSTKHTILAYTSLSREATVASYLHTEIVNPGTKTRKGVAERRKGHSTEIRGQADSVLDMSKVELRSNAPGRRKEWWQ